jgi:dTDP-4-amino-4,6-dideoxygalactose transaminase
MNGEEQKFIDQAFDTNWIAPLGPNVDAFEKEMCDYLGADHAAAVVSGTAAIHLALLILDVQRGDEIISQSMTFSASANPIVYQQAIPIFVESEKDTWNLDPNLLEDAIKKRMKSGRKPKAVIAVHIYGQPAQLNNILSVCKKYEIPLIEDAAEALGSEFNNKKAGTFSDFSILSFNGNKIITTSGGGMLVSNDEEVIKKARFLSTQARDDAPHYEHSQIGHNYRMSNVLAGIGRGQLKVLDLRVKQKRKINNFYKNIFKDIDGIEFQPELPNSKSNKWLTTITINKNKTGFDREKLREEFTKNNIESRPLWKPMHLQPVFRSAPKYVNGVSEKLFKNGLCLPSGTNLSEEDLERIEYVIRSFI